MDYFSRIEKENFFTMKTNFEAKKNEDEFVLIGKYISNNYSLIA